MAQKNASPERDLEKEREIRTLAGFLEDRGVMVRREKLARGSAFRVKSGPCHLSGRNLVFLDRRLPSDQQVTLLLDFFVERGIKLSATELNVVSPQARQILSASNAAASELA